MFIRIALVLLGWCALWTELESHRLTFLAEQFGIVYDAHNALDDARTCGKIFAMAAKKLGCNIEELFLDCKVEL